MYFYPGSSFSEDIHTNIWCCLFATDDLLLSNVKLPLIIRIISPAGLSLSSHLVLDSARNIVRVSDW